MTEIEQNMSENKIMEGRRVDVQDGAKMRVKEKQKGKTQIRMRVIEEMMRK